MKLKSLNYPLLFSDGCSFLRLCDRERDAHKKVDLAAGDEGEKRVTSQQVTRGSFGNKMMMKKDALQELFSICPLVMDTWV